MKSRKRGIYEKIINIFLDILIFIFGIILLVSIYNNVQIKILGNQYSSFFGYSTFEVQTGSMADTINPGDWIVVKITKDVKLNDIITFAYKGEFITHRIVETYKDSFVTKGDANNSKDDAINKSQIVGKVVKILPGFGIIRKTFFNPLVLISLILTLYSISFVLRSAKKNVAITNRKYNYKEKIDALVYLVLDKLLDYIKKKMKHDDVIIEENDMASLDDEVEDEDVHIEDELNIVLPEINQEEMDKTLYFRRITVDKNEIDNIDSNNDNVEVYAEEITHDIEKMPENDIEEKINLIQSKRKKFKNIVEKVIYFKKEEIVKIIDILLFEERVQSNESSIKDVLLNAYIDGKYYNFCGNVNVEFNKRTLLSRIEKEIQKTGEDLVYKYKGNDSKYILKVNKFVNIFTLVNRLEHINVTTSEINDKRELYKEKIIKILNLEDVNDLDLRDMINKIIKVQKLYLHMINYMLEKSNTNAFKLELNKIAGNKNMFAVSVEHNIAFSKVYSEYIVDKTYTEGIIAEDKVMVLLNLLLINIVRDMLDFDENKKYFIHIPNSIYLKPNKLDRIFKIIEDEYAKNNVIIVIENKYLNQISEQVSELRKRGHHFGVVFDKNAKNFDVEFEKFAEYLFIDKELMTNNFISSMCNNSTIKIINDDIVDKIIDCGGEQ